VGAVFPANAPSSPAVGQRSVYGRKPGVRSKF